jgi:hypothetical protein
MNNRTLLSAGQHFARAATLVGQDRYLLEIAEGLATFALALEDRLGQLELRLNEFQSAQRVHATSAAIRARSAPRQR